MDETRLFPFPPEAPDLSATAREFAMSGAVRIVGVVSSVPLF
jgi:hypothetical protein